jgi:hypothetical protein
MLSQELKAFAAARNADAQVAQDAQRQLYAFQERSGDFVAAAARATALAAQLEAAPTAAVDAPAALLAELSALGGAASEGVAALESAVLFIVARTPTIKEEDNLGVAAQQLVLKALSESMALLEVPDDKRRFVSVGGKLSYLKARAELEKAARAPAKDDAPPPGPSAGLVLRQLDIDTALDVARSWRVLQRVAVQAALLMARNFSSLNQPRRDNATFLS